MSNFIQLVNKLRNRLNEVSLNTVTWPQTIGFDLFTKEAINYAYMDIINAELEWPFLHVTHPFLIVPGVQLYTPTVTLTPPTHLEDGPISIDWEGFSIEPNTVLVAAQETTTIPATDPRSYTVTQSARYYQDDGVHYTPSMTQFLRTGTSPEPGIYTVDKGTYYFHASDGGQAIIVDYFYKTAPVPSNLSPINKKYIRHIDYDYWRQNLLSRDETATGPPEFVFSTQIQNQIGVSPVPDRIYITNMECWLPASPMDVTARADVTVIPIRYENVILDGALKYCYEFRENAPMAAAAEKRFNEGIKRMRTQLINKPEVMKTGFNWNRRNFSW